MKLPSRLPRATYRVQLHAGFTLHQLADIIPYLDQLGISDIYASPIFRASPGSTHGYDVCDQNEISPEIGGIDALMKVSSLLQERKMGLLVDFVPNHMGIEGPFNWRWLDVLEHGHYSRFAAFFDIQWNPRQVALHGRILVPMLHDFYGRVLEEGGIQLRYEENAFWVCYASLRFPMRPSSYNAILQRLAWFKNPGTALAQKVESIGTRFASLPRPAEVDSAKIAEQRNRDRDLLRQELSQLIEKENLGADLAEVLKAINGRAGVPGSFDNLHQILEEQHYRLAFWKSGTQEINYRRFFAVDTLVGLHMERQDVFDDTHRLLRDLIAKGVVTGVRVDHIDGLWDPEQYMNRLAQLGRPENDPAYLLVEKILTEGERLPDDWAVHGTSGYDFTGKLIDVLVDPKGEAAFTEIYRDFSGNELAPDDQAYQLKLYIMEDLFPNAIENLAADLESQVKSDRRWRDWTVNDLRLAISRIIACFPVYRTYRRAGHQLSLADIGVVERAVTETLRRNPASDPTPFRFVRDLWLGRYPETSAPLEFKAWADDWVCKLQQYTGAIMAKSIEDTFFYRYVRLFAANEVGHYPGAFGRPVKNFHDSNTERLQQWPGAMLSTSTHDTKTSEDARTRLMALAEIPDQWGAAIARWREANRGFKVIIGNTLAPDANEEYLLYQILLGAWLLDDAEVNNNFRERIRDYMRKALSESKANTTWSSPNEGWVNTTDAFVAALLDREKAQAFWADFVPFAHEIAERACSLSLAQTVLKLTVPGVPDIYQGTDLWDLSLVDPDNRRPVDYQVRQSALRDLEKSSVSDLMKSWRDGRIKMYAIQKILQHRRQFPELFAAGTYHPVCATGEHAERVLSFVRSEGDRQLWVIVLRQLGEKGSRLEAVTDVILQPPGAGPWRDLLSGREWKEGGDISSKELLADLPVAVLATS